ncbi:MAG TPA: hypothetical protein VH207_12815 [Chthoniobacterales bacterium]|jgi:hypothetical protein|nr:hypothetical protein [Chthoniobacterales bacterium]
MANLTANPFIRLAIAAVAVWLASMFIAHGQPNDLKQRILAQAQSVGADDYAYTRTVRSEPTPGGKTETTITVDHYDPVLVEQVASMTGSGLGQEGLLHQVIIYSDYRALK